MCKDRTLKGTASIRKAWLLGRLNTPTSKRLAETAGAEGVQGWVLTKTPLNTARSNQSSWQLRSIRHNVNYLNALVTPSPARDSL